MTKKTKIATFSRVMTPEEAEREKTKATSLGESLREADRSYKKRRSGG
jgi:hypothetical protein